MTAVEHLRINLPEVVARIGALVECESPTNDVHATDRCADVVDQMATDLLGQSAERVVSGGRTHLRWRFGSGPRKTLVLGHFDTVWPVGSLARLPFDLRDDRITGPGCFDMKVGVVMALHALACLDDLDGVTLLLNSDEETGSPTSRHLVESTVQGHDLTLVLEPGVDGGVKIARKGVALYDVIVEGRASHAGLDPDGGVNAVLELGHQLDRIHGLRNVAVGTSVTPTVASAGTTTNTVPAEARVAVDARAWSAAEQHRVDVGLRCLAPTIEGAVVRVEGGINRGPLERAQSDVPFRCAQALATELGIGALVGHAVGGASDGNFTAALGVATLDGLGAVGDGAHADHEHAIASAIPQRTALVARLIDEALRA